MILILKRCEKLHNIVTIFMQNRDLKENLHEHKPNKPLGASKTQKQGTTWILG